MKLYAYQRAKQGEDATEKSIAAKIGICAETVSRWKQIKGYSTWLEDQLALYRAGIHDLLEQVALDQIGSGDFRYWEAMALKFGFIREEGGDPKSGEKPKVYSLDEIKTLISIAKGDK